MAYIYPEKLKYQTYRAPLPQAHTAIPPNPKSSVPTTATGSEMGRTSRDYYNAAFPGTTPWERLGNSGGATSSHQEQTQQNYNQPPKSEWQKYKVIQQET